MVKSALAAARVEPCFELVGGDKSGTDVVGSSIGSRVDEVATSGVFAGVEVKEDRFEADKGDVFAEPALRFPWNVVALIAGDGLAADTLVVVARVARALDEGALDCEVRFVRDMIKLGSCRRLLLNLHCFDVIRGGAMFRGSS